MYSSVITSMISWILKRVWGGWFKVSVLKNNQCSFDELTGRCIRKRREITKVGKSISTYLEFCPSKKEQIEKEMQ